MSTDPVRHYPGKDLETMSFAMNYHRWIIDELAPYLGESVAEVGAGVGSISKLLLGKPIKHLSAFEPSYNNFPNLEKNLQYDSRAKAVNDFFDGRHASTGFDSVVYINVLEHIEDDRAELTNALNALNAGGHVLLFVPALSWLYSEHDRQIGHFRRYAKKGLSRLVREVGFDLVKIRYFDLVGIVPWYINFTLLRNRLGDNRLTMYDRLVVPTMRRVEKTMPPPIGKNLLIIGKKKV